MPARRREGVTVTEVILEVINDGPLHALLASLSRNMAVFKWTSLRYGTAGHNVFSFSICIQLRKGPRRRALHWGLAERVRDSPRNSALHTALGAPGQVLLLQVVELLATTVVQPSCFYAFRLV